MPGYPGSPFRDDLFDGKTVLVTGGGTGMGLEFTRAFAAHGARVLICSRNEEHLKAAADDVEKTTGNRVLYKTCDVREADQVDAVAEHARSEFGHLDVLVNNAAGNFVVPFEGMSRNAWNAVINIVLNGTFNVTKACLALMEDEGGSITNVVATYAWGASPLVSHSGAAKAGVLNLTKSLALELASKRIRVNAIAPGPVDTKGASGNLFPSEDIKQRIMDSIPAGRFGTPEEMALAVLWLNCAAADYVNGECLVVDGGQWLNNGMLG